MATTTTVAAARERILSTAYTLFCRHGIRAIGVDTIIERSGVAKMTLYRHFKSKDDLVLAVLDRREEQWTKQWLQVEVGKRTTEPAERLLAIFDVFDGWFRRRTFEGCLFINALIEIDDRSHPVHRECRRQLTRIREFVAELAADAGVADPDAFARQWHILMKGSIVAAGEGDANAAMRAKEMGALLLADRLALTSKSITTTAADRHPLKPRLE
jgi:AcrR family transcriptional regulator